MAAAPPEEIVFCHTTNTAQDWPEELDKKLRSNPWRPVCGSDSGLIHQGMDTGGLRVSGTRVLTADPLSPVGCKLGPSWMWLHQAPWMLNRIGIGAMWKSGQHLELLVTFLRPFRGSFCSVAKCNALLWGPLPSGSTIAMGGCAWSTVVFRWVVHVKWLLHKSQDPRFPSRNFDCNKMINFIHFLCTYSL